MTAPTPSPVTDERLVGIVPTHPERRLHFCNDMACQVHLGDGAFSSIVNPWRDSGVEWQLRYGNADAAKYVAASLIESYDYLLSDEINTTEAIKRLRILRKARSALRHDDVPATPQAPQGE